MYTTSRSRLSIFAASWAPLPALLPATLAFDRFALGPSFLAALLLVAFGGAGGALVAGGLVLRRVEGTGCAWAAASGIVSAALVTLSIWLIPTATMTGFLPAVPGGIFVLFGDPSIFLQSALCKVVVFNCAASAGLLLLSPLVGPAVLRLLREEGDGALRRITGETG